MQVFNICIFSIQTDDMGKSTKALYKNEYDIISLAACSYVEYSFVQDRHIPAWFAPWREAGCRGEI